MTRINVGRRLFLRRAAWGASALGVSNNLLESLAFAQPTQGRTLTVALPVNPLTIDPINQLNHDAMVLGQAVFENLVEFDVDGNLRPQLATKLPKISDDRRSYVFDLRDDVTFQNGQKMTAEDVKYSFDYMLNPDNKASRRSIFTRISKVTVLSPTSVQIDLSEPYAPWTAFLTKFMGIFPTGSREKFGADYFKSSPIGVGTGPGIFEEWRPTVYVSFSKNPNYWRKGLPHWDRLVVKIIPEDSVRVAYLLTGQADIISAPPPRDFARLRSLAGFVGESRPCLGGWFSLFMNNQRPPFDDVNFRRAVSMAIDRKTIAEKVYYGMLDPSAIPAPPRSWWFDKSANDSIDFNLDLAKDTLAKSKYPNGAEFDMLIPAETYLLDVKDAAIVLQSQLAKINVKINLKVMEFNVMLATLIRGENQAVCFVSMSPGEPTFLIQADFMPGQILAKGTNYNNTQQLGDVLREVFANDDQAKLKPIHSKLQQLLARDVPMAWIGFVHAANLWRQPVKNFTVNQGLTMAVSDVQI